jgi:hypothetical protein
MVVENSDSVLKLRLISLQPAMSAPPPPSAPRAIAPPSAVPQKIPVKELLSPPALRFTPTASTPAYAGPIISSTPRRPVATDQFTDHPGTAGNGGFRDRLSDAQHAQGMRGVPGSDKPVLPGVALTSATDQGVGSVMRSAQRLFGVTNRHCVDVEVWRQLSQGKLKARYLSAVDVEKQAERYNCDRPLGLNF